MKKVVFCLAFLSVLAAVSCQKKEMDMPSNKTVLTVTPVLDELNDVKTTLGEVAGVPTILWGTDEYLKLYYYDKEAHFVNSDAATKDANNGQATRSFTFTVTPEEAESYTFGAVYPASAAVPVSNKQADSYKVSLPAIQNATASSYDPAAFIMVAQSATQATFPSTWTANFRRAVALNKLTLYNVPQNVQAVEITAAGKDIAGSRFFDLTKGQANEVYAGSSAITVKYASPLAAGNVTVYFTSWNATLAAGESLTIKVVGATSTYTRTVTAGGNGIKFSESKLCSLGVDFSGVPADAAATTLDFAKAYAGELDVWAATNGSVMPYDNAGYYEVGNIIPQDYSFFVGTTLYTKADAFYVACKLYKDLVVNSYPFAEADLAVSPGCSWGEWPYNESSANSFKNPTVKYDLISNIVNRNLTYCEGHGNVFPNLCGADGHAGLGYTGIICLERANLMLARVFKYIVDNEIYSDVKTAITGVMFKSDLYAANPIMLDKTALAFGYEASSATLTLTAEADWSAETEADWITISETSGSAVNAKTITISVPANAGAARTSTVRFKHNNKLYVDVKVSQDPAPSDKMIKDFAQQYITLIDIWNSTTGTVNPQNGSQPSASGTFTDAHYIPKETTITVGNATYSSADIFELAMRCYLLLRGYDGNNTSASGAGKIPAASGATMSGTKIPSTHSYVWGNYPWLEGTKDYPLLGGAQTTTVKLDILDNFAQRNVNFPMTNSKKISNMCNYTTNQVAGYTGYFSAMRGLITYAKFFKYLLDNNLEDATGISASQEFTSDFV
ncbi:MAG: BACON domain-containing protein [Bacteroidales bacterium]|nr:BACON domain-containing protein [Bacteroidales bacterium]